MFKSLLVSSLSVILLSSTAVKANEVNDALQNICTIVKNDDTQLLRRKVNAVRKEFQLRFNDYYEDISCGGVSLIEYADSNSSANALKYMVSRLKPDTLKNTGYLSNLSESAIQVINKRID